MTPIDTLIQPCAENLIAGKLIDSPGEGIVWQVIESSPLDSIRFLLLSGVSKELGSYYDVSMP